MVYSQGERVKGGGPRGRNKRANFHPFPPYPMDFSPRGLGSFPSLTARSASTFVNKNGREQSIKCQPIGWSLNQFVPAGTDQLEHATPILSLRNDIFTD